MRSLVWITVAGCVAPASEVESPPACEFPQGGQYGQTLSTGDGQSDRVYFVYVPRSAACDAVLPLLVDFHGTAAIQPELAYGTEELIAFAEEHQVVVARPRSRSADFDGTSWYQWDVNEGDLARNHTFAKNLVADLLGRFPIDPSRVYASGFSSGANMAASFLADPTSPFAGVAPIAGGLWAPDALPDLTAGPRLYVGTGYRDYLWDTARSLLTRVRAAGLPDDRIDVAPSGGGHDLHGWQFEELFAFLDAGDRPDAAAPLAQPWSADVLPEGADVNALARDGAVLVAAGARGRVWRRAAGTWSLELSRDTADYTALCFGPAGRGFVGGSGVAAHRSTGSWSADAIAPDFGTFGTPSVTSATCRSDGSIAIVGYWTAAVTGDGGDTWSKLSAPTGTGIDQWMLGVAASPAGSTVIGGYESYLGRVAPGTANAVAMTPRNEGWWNAVAAADGGQFWAVGDRGSVVRSSDDGKTWEQRASGTVDDLYAVHFADAYNGAAVGRHGTVIVTRDGGRTWTPRPLGRDVYLGAVFVDATTIWVAGQDGLVAKSPL